MRIKQLFAAAIMMALPFAFTSCDEDIWGEWSKPTPTVITPEEEEEDYDAVSNALTFEPVSSNVTVTIKNPLSLKIKYSLAGADKVEKGGTTADIVIEIPAGKTLQLYGDGTTNTTYSNLLNSTTITFSAECYVYGNIMSLVDEEGFATNKTLTGDYTFACLFCPNVSEVFYVDPFSITNNLKLHDTKDLLLPATELTTGCYFGMFAGNPGMTSAPKLPATTMAEVCYAFMFRGCTGLTTAPEKLPAENLAASCYGCMFQGCTGLTAAPKLPATTLATQCYADMFNGCTALTTAPKLPATTLATQCYTDMFNGCTALTTAPELPATTLATQCYHAMFRDCTALTSVPEKLPAMELATNCYTSMFCGCIGLTKAPELPATTLVSRCYNNMFQNCKALNTVPEKLPATTLALECYNNMFNGCTSLTTAPELPATNLAASCYGSMFQGCTSLTTAPKLPATTLAKECYEYMFTGCTSLTEAWVKAAYNSTDCSCMFYNCTNSTTSKLYTASESATSWGTGSGNAKGKGHLPADWIIDTNYTAW